MRTTLSLDADVATLLESVRRARNLGLKETVNEALRRGLAQMAAPATPRPPFRTVPLDVGSCLVNSLDDVWDALALAEGEDFR